MTMYVSSSELDIVISSEHAHHYLGDFPLDKIPPVDKVFSLVVKEGLLSKYIISFIVNCDVEGEPGSHWLAIVVFHNGSGDGGGEVIFIEPMGLDRLLLTLLNPLNQWIRKALSYGDGMKFTTLPFPIQPLHSTLCGAYCAYILSHLHLYNFQLNTLIAREFLEENLSENDHRISNWWYKRSEAYA